jgi:hypothetical protein
LIARHRSPTIDWSLSENCRGLRISQAELSTAFAKGWTIDSIAPTQTEVAPAFQKMFSPGGPKEWFLTATRR